MDTVTAPTADELREAILLTYGRPAGQPRTELEGGPSQSMQEAVEELADVILWTGYAGDPEVCEPGSSGTIWQDLRPSQRLRLEEIMEAAKERAIRRAFDLALEEVVAAGLQFAAEHPDAPRARRLVSV